ncbi:ATP synthase mitochondrial F1 complex assembly factor 1 [Zootermopsis nevadensis]|uniref:ATP synthase mitochondrial F1 complex assembly factor 1 n=1 Tax=Zootermopsis nevadensis TaxID=136037 RepID=A0A067QV74_ZOONE|nr:ATP synthase mitochondrial F1 complex assembly factor 1 [Zootermopsis nevadensis]KDR09704.1 ATP synthase mitochondrial F1 complex assembly factor 1 [Zootermopsis nevadensis]
MAVLSRGYAVVAWNWGVLLQQRRNIMSSIFRAEKAIEDLQNNPYYEKYCRKITAFQNTSPGEFMTRLREHKEQNTTIKQAYGEEREFSSLLHPKEDIAKCHSPTFTKQKVLNDVMKMELVADKKCEEIKQIWEEYHKQKEVIAAAVPSIVYDTINLRSQQFPVFVFPLPRDRGYEFILCQFSGHEAHFTPLINYQAHKENAPECLTMTHYTDLKEKGLVLMRGEYNKDILNGTEAQCLANQLQLYYGQDNAKRLKLLERFTYTPQEFKHMDLIAELECLSL